MDQRQLSASGLLTILYDWEINGYSGASIGMKCIFIFEHYKLTRSPENIPDG